MGTFILEACSLFMDSALAGRPIHASAAKSQVVHGSLSRTNRYSGGKKVFESEMTVTRKGRVTIPAELRKKYGIREGMKVDITDVPSDLLLKPIPHMNDWAGADAGTYTYEEMVEKLDRLKDKWRQ